ncbi:transglycosylase SLT domain-containing protein [Actinomycetospora sp. CA-101289]|uniref:transglycosylase SLT domain-containing protein n=1 Tax=Actinomycetospora sp. CA-101289 TaxID=3239893 RepID=UPI003D968E2C
MVAFDAVGELAAQPGGQELSALADRVQRLDPEVLRAVGRGLGSMAEGVDGSLATVGRHGEEVRAAWRGRGAEAFTEYLGDLDRAGRTTLDASGRMRERVDGAGQVLDGLRREVDGHVTRALDAARRARAEALADPVRAPLADQLAAQAMAEPTAAARAALARAETDLGDTATVLHELAADARAFSRLPTPDARTIGASGWAPAPTGESISTAPALADGSGSGGSDGGTQGIDLSGGGADSTSDLADPGTTGDDSGSGSDDCPEDGTGTGDASDSEASGGGAGGGGSDAGASTGSAADAGDGSGSGDASDSEASGGGNEAGAGERTADDDVPAGDQSDDCVDAGDATDPAAADGADAQDTDSEVDAQGDDAAVDVDGRDDDAAGGAGADADGDAQDDDAAADATADDADAQDDADAPDDADAQDDDAATGSDTDGADADADADADAKEDGAVTGASTDPDASGDGAAPTGGPQGQVGDWIREATVVLQAEGVPLDKMNPDDIATIIEHESGGDPEATNDWDSNAAKGTPSQGLMQTIGPTFDSYKLEGHDEIKDPIDNIIAGVRYAIDRYGSVSQVPGVEAVARGDAYVGY